MTKLDALAAAINGDVEQASKVLGTLEVQGYTITRIVATVPVTEDRREPEPQPVAGEVVKP